MVPLWKVDCPSAKTHPGPHRISSTVSSKVVVEKDELNDISVSTKPTKGGCSAPSAGEHTLYLYVIKVQGIRGHSRIDESNGMRCHFEPGDRSEEQL